MKRKTIIVVLSAILVIPNIPLIVEEIAHRLDEGYFRYSNLAVAFRSP
ncbi:hypothetical protein [Sphingobacterium multivorum]|nr:hypothetical protein [Sphingobacterium multivorum]QRQ63250.1 hypothetical protein I6J33_09890 [Sphingobacterium multivorum]